MDQDEFLDKKQHDMPLTIDTILEIHRRVERVMAMPPHLATPGLVHVPVIFSEHATELVGHTFDPIPWSPHRSQRIWKKLIKRQRLTVREDRRPCVYMFHGRMIVHPALRTALAQ